jgi:hypothetical protein
MIGIWFVGGAMFVAFAGPVIEAIVRRRRHQDALDRLRWSSKQEYAQTFDDAAFLRKQSERPE